jgi:glucose/arabinose dehydrogenase
MRILFRTSQLALGFCLSASIMAACAQQPSGGELRSGWKSLQGDSLSNCWRGFRQTDVPAGWSNTEGVLKRTADAGGDLMMLEPFEFFELSLEYRLERGATSGVLFRVTEDAKAAADAAPEIQLADPAAGEVDQSGWLVGLLQSGSRRLDGKGRENAERPVGSWNHLQLLVTRNVCEVNLNGVRYYMFNLGSDEFRARVAKSRFAGNADFAKVAKGYIALQAGKGTVYFRDVRVRALPPDGTAPDPIDGVLTTVGVKQAFPNLQWADWQPVNDDGLNVPFRPVMIAHAGDGSGRLFVGEQHGKVYQFRGDPAVTESRLFLDISHKVRYSDDQNEEGFLGFAFHPRFKENGAVFAYYTAAEMPRVSVISRFRLAKDGQRIDPASEEELLRIGQPYWNHNGGTIAFGPDGYLYIGLGDGGNANDPHGNGQNLETLLGSLLRIDVDKKSDGRPYGIPADNPFVDRKGARPEIYAYGFRNIWRLSFDRQTGLLWAADVGQNLWEEINIVIRGGNYGWNFREGLHPFGPNENESRVQLIDPIWEYDHQVGKSITGGSVYRGKDVPDLVGKYLYADYVTGKIWALDYDAEAKKVRSNYRIESPMMPIITFGEDESGEIYFGLVAANGQGLYRFTKK